MRMSDWSSDVCSSDLVDVRAFEHPLADVATALEARDAEVDGAGGRGLDEVIVADLLEPRGVREARDLDLADLARLGLAGDRRRDGAVGADRDRGDRKSTRLNSSH